MALWHDNRNIDDLVRSSDRTLNVLVVVLLAAFALGSGAYYYGQMNPRVAPTLNAASTSAEQPAQQR